MMSECECAAPFKERPFQDSRAPPSREARFTPQLRAYAGQHWILSQSQLRASRPWSKADRVRPPDSASRLATCCSHHGWAEVADRRADV